MQMRSLRFFLILAAVVVLFQVASLMAPHLEGDEMVFLGLSQRMSWDLSGYTVMDIEPVNQFANRLYRAPIFMHPPLFPLILKFGSIFANPVLFGILFNGAMKLLLALVVYAVGKELMFREGGARVAALMVVACPVLGFIGSRVLSDSLFVVLLWASILFLLRGVREASPNRLFLSAVVFSLFLNSKFQALFVLPGYVAALVFAMWSLRSRISDRRSLVLSLAGAVSVIGILGLVHYFRLFNAFGIEGVRDLMIVERPVNAFLRRIGARGMIEMAIYLLFIFPLFVLLLLPSMWRALLRDVLSEPGQRIAWALLALPLLADLALTLKWFYQQERYWAGLVPFGFLVVACAMTRIRYVGRWLSRVMVSGFIVLLFLGSFMTNVLIAGSMTSVVRPVLFRFLPFLIREGGLFADF
jgi:hypothetical protein